MVKVYGYSDDNVVIEGADYPFDEVGCYEQKVTVWFTDGTIIEVNYDDNGIWRINEKAGGHAPRTLKVCDGTDEDDYSDIFKIDADVENVCVGDVIEDVQEIKKIFRNVKKDYPMNYIQMAYEEVFND